MGWRFDSFELYFLMDLDSWLSKDIMCCSSCYDDFKKKWPATVARDLDLQYGYMSLDSFYEGSRLRGVYKRRDFQRLSRFLLCPRCGERLKGEFWAYNHPFSVPDNFEGTIEEIAEVAARTPFLLLENKFARRVLGVIRDLGVGCQSIPLAGNFYRARLAKDVPSPSSLDFGPPPMSKVQEGRFNHAGRSMLYIASSVDTCFAEVGLADEPLHIAELEITREIKILDLVEPDCEVEEVDSLLMAIGWSAMASAPRHSDGWDRPEYVFTRFLADCAIDVGYDAIRYASTRDSDGYNVVFVDPASILGDVKISRIQTYASAPRLREHP